MKRTVFLITLAVISTSARSDEPVSTYNIEKKEKVEVKTLSPVGPNEYQYSGKVSPSTQSYTGVEVKIPLKKPKRKK